MSITSMPSLDEQIDELKRELSHRRRYYPVRVAQRTITREDADLWVARMDAALITLMRIRLELLG